MIFLLFCLVSNIYAQKRWFVTAGGNRSQFYDTKSEAKPGFSIGIGRERQLGGQLSFMYALEYRTRNCIIRERIVGGLCVDLFDIYKYDFYIKLRYIDIPVLMRYKIYEKRNQFYTFFGPRFCIGLQDGSERGNRTFLFKCSEHPNYFYHYRYIGETDIFHSFDSSTINLAFGFGIQQPGFGLEFGTDMVVLGDITSIAGASLHHKFFALDLSVYLYF